MRSEQEANRAIELYADTVRRICMLYLKSYADTEDIFQTVFIKYLCRSAAFESAEHEKAWFIRVTINACKDLLKSFFKKRTVPLTQANELTEPPAPEHGDILKAVLDLKENYKNAVYLHYYEGYTAAQIGKLLHKSENTIYTHLARARAILKERLGDEFEQDT